MSYCFIYFTEKQKISPTANRYPLRSKSKVSARAKEITTNEPATQEIEPSPNKRPKLELPTLGMILSLFLLYIIIIIYILQNCLMIFINIRVGI